MAGAALAIRAERENSDGDLAAVLDRAVREIARTITERSEGVHPHPAALVRRIRTGDAIYHVRGMQLPADGDASSPIVVTVERLDPEPPSETEIRDTFGLTRRESAVARLIALGHTNNEIADRLAISRHTARHHTENVMAKLEIRARDRIARTLNAGVATALN